MADNGGNMGDTTLGGAAKADTRRIQGEADTRPDRHIAAEVWGKAEADTRRTHGGQGLEAPERPKRTQGGQTQGGQGLVARRTRFAGPAKAGMGRTQAEHMAVAPPQRIEGGRKADARRTDGGQKPTTQGVADKDWRRGKSQQHRPDTTRTPGGQGADKEARPKPTTQGGHKAENWTQGGQVAHTRRTHCGHMADKLRSRCQSISRPAFFS